MNEFSPTFSVSTKIHLYFRGRTEPYKISAAESGDAAAIYF